MAHLTDCGNCGKIFEAASQEATREYHRYCPECQARLDDYQQHTKLKTSEELTAEIARLEKISMKDRPKREAMLFGQAVTDAYFHRRHVRETEQGLPYCGW